MSHNSMRLSRTEADAISLNPRPHIPDTALRRYCPLDNGRYALEIDLRVAPQLGLLSKLPAELQEVVMRNMDIVTLMVWRRVNKRAMGMVAGLVEWKKVLLHAASIFRMAIGLKTHNTFTIVDLCSTLYEQKCHKCEVETTFIDMTPVQRTCFSCAKQDFRFLRMSLNLMRMRQLLRFRRVVDEAPSEDERLGMMVRLTEQVGCVEAAWLDPRGMGKIE